jgi:hypothetical protein
LRNSFNLPPRFLVRLRNTPPSSILPPFVFRVLRFQLDESLSPFQFMLQHTDRAIAEQLTLVDSMIYSSIEPFELLNQSWNSPKTRHRSPRLSALIERSTHCSFWIATLILGQSKLDARVSAFSKFVSVAKILISLNNFNTGMAVVAALNSAAVHRLNKTKKKVDKKLLLDFAKLEKSLEPQMSYKTYREMLEAAPLPSLPYV